MEIDQAAPDQDLDEYGMIRDAGAYENDGVNGGVKTAAGLEPITPGKKRIRLHEIHMEEDAGKLVHDAAGTLIDYNRCGVPLVEIVSEPDFRSADEVVDYLEKLREMLVYMDCLLYTSVRRTEVSPFDASFHRGKLYLRSVCICAAYETGQAGRHDVRNHNRHRSFRIL